MVVLMSFGALFHGETIGSSIGCWTFEARTLDSLVSFVQKMGVPGSKAGSLGHAMVPERHGKSMGHDPHNHQKKLEMFPVFSISKLWMFFRAYLYLIFWCRRLSSHPWKTYWVASVPKNFPAPWTQKSSPARGGWTSTTNCSQLLLLPSEASPENDRKKRIEFCEFSIFGDGA